MSKRTKQKRARRKSPSRAPTRPVREWVGGKCRLPAYVDAEQPFRPEIILWLELPDDLVVGSVLLGPDEPALSFSDSFAQARANPLAGPPRKPRRVRVGDPILAAEIIATHPGLNVVIAPTPEIDTFVRAMAEQFSDDDHDFVDTSYLSGGLVSPAVVEALFLAARRLYQAAPWKVMDDGQVLRLDIPRYDVDGACVSVIGALDESLGFLIFPSLHDYDRFLAASEEASWDEGETPNLGSGFLALNYERAAELPPAMRSEAASHGWPVDNVNAYPWVQPVDADLVSRSATEGEIRIVTACANALTAFFAKHQNVLGDFMAAAVSESYVDDNDVDARLTAPYDDDDEPGVDRLPRMLNIPASGPPNLPPGRRSGRNDPCPCGSGKKYKRCCLAKDEAARDQILAPSRLHDLDRRLTGQIKQYAYKRFGAAFDDRWETLLDFDSGQQLLLSWLLHDDIFAGASIADHYRDAQQNRLAPRDAAWLEAQRAAWLSVWEVVDVEPGHNVKAHDRLTGETRVVEEVKASLALVSGDCVLARVVFYGDGAVFCGIHSNPLKPSDSAEIVERMRKRLRRKREVPSERLREPKHGRFLLELWQDAVDVAYTRFDNTSLHNSDGDSLLLTIDHFDYAQADAPAIEQRLRELPRVLAPDPGDEDQNYAVLRSTRDGDFDETIAGFIALGGGSLRIDTNSVARADILRVQLERACGELIRHRAREHADPLSIALQDEFDDAPDFATGDIPPDLAQAIARQFSERHYREWPDYPLPALDGKTPREAVAAKRGREQVDLILQDMEHAEARKPAAERFDFASVRRDLGLVKDPA